MTYVNLKPGGNLKGEMAFPIAVGDVKDILGDVAMAEFIDICDFYESG